MENRTFIFCIYLATMWFPCRTICQSDRSRFLELFLNCFVETFTVPQHSNWVKGNAGLFGFYRVNYDQDNWQALIQQLNTDHTVSMR